MPLMHTEGTVSQIYHAGVDLLGIQYRDAPGIDPTGLSHDRQCTLYRVACPPLIRLSDNARNLPFAIIACVYRSAPPAASMYVGVFNIMVTLMCQTPSKRQTKNARRWMIVSAYLHSGSVKTPQVYRQESANTCGFTDYSPKKHAASS